MGEGVLGNWQVLGQEARSRVSGPVSVWSGFLAALGRSRGSALAVPNGLDLRHAMGGTRLCCCFAAQALLEISGNPIRVDVDTFISKVRFASR